MSSIFEKRVEFKPFEYPDVIQFADAINHSYWLVSEWNFEADKQDFHTRLTPIEKNAIKNTLLAISQIEVSVKKFWTKLGDRFPKPEFEIVGVTFGECHIEGTEILTPTGWKDFRTVAEGDDVIQFHENNTFSITKVLKKYQNMYSGKLIKFSKNYVETVVTPNHRIIFYNKDGVYSEIPAQSFQKNSDLKLPCAAKIVDGEITTLSFMDRLRIAIQADGSRRYYMNGDVHTTRKGNGAGAEYEIRISRQRKIERLDWILGNLSLDYSKKEIPSRPGMFCYTIRIDDQYDYKEFEWVHIMNKSSSWCENFVEELSHWDGQLIGRKNCKYRYNSSNKNTADKAQMVGVAAGYRTNLLIKQDNRKDTYKTMFMVTFTENKERVSNNLNREEIDYDGNVYCVTVPSGAIITRYNGKTFIGGNSEVRHMRAYSHLLEVLDLNSDFAMLLQVPVIQRRVDYLTKYLRGASEHSDQNYTLVLTLFSIFIENVSLFSQFAIIRSFNREKNLLKDIDNVVQATQKEETVHALLGVEILKYVRSENPDWFNDEFYEKIYRACKKAYDAEAGIIDWIYEAGELEFLPKEVLKEYIKFRFNESLAMIGGEPVFDINNELIEKISWFDDETHAEVNVDFFHKKSVNYSKGVQSITAEDLF